MLGQLIGLRFLSSFLVDVLLKKLGLFHETLRLLLNKLAALHYFLLFLFHASEYFRLSSLNQSLQILEDL